MPADLKQIREVDKDYLAYIRRQPCLAGINSMLGVCAHHTKSIGSGGSDYLAVPLSPLIHGICHNMGEKTFQVKHNIAFDKEIIRLLIGYIKELRE